MTRHQKFRNVKLEEWTLVTLGIITIRNFMSGDRPMSAKAEVKQSWYEGNKTYGQLSVWRPTYVSPHFTKLRGMKFLLLGKLCSLKNMFLYIISVSYYRCWKLLWIHNYFFYWVLFQSFFKFMRILNIICLL